MSGRYWNEETQRWEDGTEGAAHVTPPPPPRPNHAPPPPPGQIWDPDAPRVPAPDAPTIAAPGGAPPSPPPPPPEPVWDPDAARVPTPDGGGGGDWPAGVTPDPPAAVGGHSRRVVWGVVGGAAAVGVAVSLVLTVVIGGGNGDDRAKGGASPTVSTSETSDTSEPTSASPTTYESESPSPFSASPSVYEPPSGYVLFDDPQGFRIAVPEGWLRTTESSQFGMDVVNYRSPDGDRRLQVYEVAEASPDESFQLYLSSAVRKPAGFEELSLDNLDTASFTGTRLEYLADSLRGEPDIGTWHVVDERFEAADSRLYAIASYGPDSDGRADERQLLATALRWFCPPYTTCES